MHHSLRNLIQNAVKTGGSVILDGATGTELDRCGIVSAGPAWSAVAIMKNPEIVRKLHSDYVEAGAEVILANTFRTTDHAIRSAGIGLSWQQAADTAVRLALEAADGRCLVAASIGPLNDCYRPDLAPDEKTAFQEHLKLISTVKDVGAHAVWIETMSTLREAAAACRAAAETGIDFVAGFVPDSSGRLLDGTSMTGAVGSISGFGPEAVCVNCAPYWIIDRAFRELSDSTDLPAGLKVHMGRAEKGQDWQGSAWMEPEEFADKSLDWVKAGARLIGGCCGSGPEHIRALSRKYRNRQV